MLSTALILAPKLVHGEKTRAEQSVGSNIPRNLAQELQEDIGLSAFGNYYITTAAQGSFYCLKLKTNRNPHQYPERVREGPQ